MLQLETTVLCAGPLVLVARQSAAGGQALRDTQGGFAGASEDFPERRIMR